MGDEDYRRGYSDGWKDCYESMIKTANVPIPVPFGVIGNQYVVKTCSKCNVTFTLRIGELPKCGSLDCPGKMLCG